MGYFLSFRWMQSTILDRKRIIIPYLHISISSYRYITMQNTWRIFKDIEIVFLICIIQFVESFSPNK